MIHYSFALRVHYLAKTLMAFSLTKNDDVTLESCAAFTYWFLSVKIFVALVHLFPVEMSG